MDKFNNSYDLLIESNLFTERELQIVCNICGNSVDTLNDAVFACYGVRTVDDLFEECEITI